MKVRVALGFKPRTGRAVLVALSGSLGDAHILDRREIPLLPAGEWAPYHAVEGLPLKEADRKVRASIAAARRMAKRAIQDAVKRCESAGGRVAGCGILVGTGMPEWTTDEVLAVHVRMHKVEGEIFREILVEGAKECGLRVATLPDKAAFEAAAKKLHVTRARLDAGLAAMGKTAGPPWGKYQKEAAVAALAALES